MQAIKKYLSLVKFSHTIFAMPFAMIGFTLGVHAPIIPLYNTTDILVKLGLVIVCMITARNAAMAFNRYLDRNFDKENPRTAIREIPRGIISPNNALRFVILNSLLFLITTFFINRTCFSLSAVALFVILFYSYTKRFTALCHLVLGIGLSLAPIGAYLAVANSWDSSLVPLLLSINVIFWVGGFDIIYSLQDTDFDHAHKLHSIPAKLGKNNALRLSIALHALASLCIILAGIFGNFHFLYWIGCVAYTSMLIYQHTLVKPSDLSRVNVAFMTTNGIASVLFAMFVIADILLY